MLPTTIPYEEDEVFYSWIMRIVIHNYADESYAKAFKEWVNEQKYNDSKHVPRVDYDFKENLYYWMQNVGWSLKDAMNYFMKTSLYPIMSPFMTQYHRKLYILLAFGKLTMPQINTLNAILTTITEKLKMCPECAKETIENKGIFWYRRAHQIPGVTACYRHGCRLINSPQKRFHELDLNEIDLSDVQLATKIEQEYAFFAYQYLNDLECCTYEYMHEFIMKRIKDKFPINTGIAFEKYTKENGYYALFSMKPSYFVYRKCEEGTFFDPQNNLVALFTLYQNFNQFKVQAEGIIRQKSYVVQIPVLMRYVEYYVEKNIKINKSEVSAQNPRSRNVFCDEIRAITGNEYKLIGNYENSVRKVTLLHTKCNRTFKMRPVDFLDGRRCTYCKQLTFSDEFCKYVEDVTNNRYTILGHASNNLYVVHDRETLLDYTLGKAKILQEINRKNENVYFENINQKAKNLVTTSAKIYNDICKKALIKVPIFVEDIREIEPNCPDYSIKHSFAKLSKEGRIVRCYPGVYKFPEHEFTDLELLEARYIQRGEQVVGAYYGSSLASMVLGLNPIDNTTKYIMTNKETGTHGRNRIVFGIKVRIKGCKSKITKENYIVLQTLDFLLNYWKYTNAGRKEVVSKVIQYWEKNQIPVNLVIKYQKTYNWKRNKICESAIEVLKCVYQKKEWNSVGGEKEGIINHI